MSIAQVMVNGTAIIRSYRYIIIKYFFVILIVMIVKELSAGYKI